MMRFVLARFIIILSLPLLLLPSIYGWGVLSPTFTVVDELRLRSAVFDAGDVLARPTTLARDLRRVEIRTAIEDSRRRRGHLG